MKLTTKAAIGMSVLGLLGLVALPLAGAYAETGDIDNQISVVDTASIDTKTAGSVATIAPELTRASTIRVGGVEVQKQTVAIALALVVVAIFVLILNQKEVEPRVNEAAKRR